MTDDAQEQEVQVVTPTRSLAAKIAAASRKVGGLLATDKENTDQHYRYNSADLILSACGQALAEQEVIILPTILNADVVASTYGRESKTRYDAKIQFLMIVTDGIEEREALWIGMGDDYVVPGKAYFKAVTSGHKYFLAKLMNVGAFNEDGEHEPGDASATGKANTKSVFANIPRCPVCGGTMWDNRTSKTNPKQPDLKCKDKKCKGVIWKYNPEPPPEEPPQEEDTDGYVTLIAKQKTSYNGIEYLPGQSITARDTLAVDLLDTEHWIIDIKLSELYGELSDLLVKLYQNDSKKIMEAVKAASKGAATLVTELTPLETEGLIKIAKGRLAKAHVVSSMPEVVSPDELPISNANPEDGPF